MPTATTYPAADIRPGMRVKFATGQDEFSTGDVTDWYTEPLGFIVYDRYTGTHDISAKMVIGVLLSEYTGKPTTDLMADHIHGFSWADVTA